MVVLLIDYQSISNEYKNVPHGNLRLNMIKKAIETADYEKNPECSLRCRYDYLHEIEFYGDEFEAVLMFPEYLSIYDNYHKKIEGYKSIHYDMLLVYTWILLSAIGFYQIPKTKIMEYFEDFKKRLLENGYSLKTYYCYKAKYLKYFDKELYKKTFQLYLSMPKEGEFIRCDACELKNKIYFEMYYGDIKKAMELAKPILNGEVTSCCCQENIYENIINCCLQNKLNMEIASKYEKLLYAKISKNISFLSSIGTLLEYFAVTNLNKGIKRLQSHFDWYLKSKTPSEKFYFELGAYKLLKKLKEKKQTISILLPHNFCLYKEDSIYSVDMLINYFKNNLTDTAAKFDKRNESNYFMNMINETKQ